MSTVKTGDLCDAESLSELILPDSQRNNSGVASPQQRALGETWHPRLAEKSIRKGMRKSKKEEHEEEHDEEHGQKRKTSLNPPSCL